MVFYLINTLINHVFFFWPTILRFNHISGRQVIFTVCMISKWGVGCWLLPSPQKLYVLGEKIPAQGWDLTGHICACVQSLCS